MMVVIHKLIENIQCFKQRIQTYFLPRSPSNLVTPLGPWPLRPHFGCTTVCSMFVLLYRLQDNKFLFAWKSVQLKRRTVMFIWLF